MISRALEKHRIVFGVPRGWHNDRLTRGTRMRHLSYIADQKSHPLVGLQDLHCLVVGRLLEALSIYFDDLVTYLKKSSINLYNNYQEFFC